MAGFDPNQPRDEEGKWTEAENAARVAAGLDNPVERAMKDSGLSRGQIQGFERVRIRKEYGGGSGYIFELSPDGTFAKVYRSPEGEGKFLGYFHLSDLMF